MDLALMSDRMAPVSRDDGTVAPVQRSTPAIASTVERAYLAHYRDVYRYVIAMTHSVSDAEEVTSEVFERALRTWKAEPVRVEAWLLLTARRIVTDRWRRARRLLSKRPVGGGRERAGAAQSEVEFWAWFDAVAGVLTDRQREVLVLRYQRDLTDADIGTILGLSESGVRSLVARALETLRAHPELL